jgi:hypothetical protein
MVLELFGELLQAAPSAAGTSSYGWLLLSDRLHKAGCAAGIGEDVSCALQYDWTIRS